MTSRRKYPVPSMHGPAVYRIRVRGKLGQEWSDRLSGMRITQTSEAGGEEDTILEGRLADQAALSGVLNSLYDLHMPVASVECLEAQ